MTVICCQNLLMKPIWGRIKTKPISMSLKGRRCALLL